MRAPVLWEGYGDLRFLAGLGRLVAEVGPRTLHGFSNRRQPQSSSIQILKEAGKILPKIQEQNGNRRQSLAKGANNEQSSAGWRGGVVADDC